MRLLEAQALKDVKSLESKCFERSIDCAYDAYEFTAQARLEALKRLNGE